MTGDVSMTSHLRIDNDTRLLISEAEFQATVLDMAQSLGWYCHHEYGSQRAPRGRNMRQITNKGFPDLVLAKDGITIYAELKTEKGKVDKDQWAWLNRLTGLQKGQTVCRRRSTEGVNVSDSGVHITTGYTVIGAIWRPRDLDNGVIDTLLREGWCRGISTQGV